MAPEGSVVAPRSEIDTTCGTVWKSRAQGPVPSTPTGPGTPPPWGRSGHVTPPRHGWVQELRVGTGGSCSRRSQRRRFLSWWIAQLWATRYTPPPVCSPMPHRPVADSSGSPRITASGRQALLGPRDSSSRSRCVGSQAAPSHFWHLTPRACQSLDRFRFRESDTEMVGLRWRRAPRGAPAAVPSARTEGGEVRLVSRAATCARDSRSHSAGSTIRSRHSGGLPPHWPVALAAVDVRHEAAVGLEP